MTIENVRIHPAIGIARVGNSPEEFFLGPERPGERPAPEGGFKDDRCRVKRQGARFRLFAEHDDGTVEELSATDADVEWTVRLANKKATTRDRNPIDSWDQLTPEALTIDTGTERLDGPNRRTVFDPDEIRFASAADPDEGWLSSAEVSLGEIRTDTAGRLIVLGGTGEANNPGGQEIDSDFDNTGWYDDVSDGPVSATVTVDGRQFESNAWVVVGPPKFAPGIENMVTLYERLYDLMANATGIDVDVPNRPSYAEHVYPVLERAKQVQWVSFSSPTDHGDAMSGIADPDPWEHPIGANDSAVRELVFSRLKDPDSPSANDMPRLASNEDIGHLPRTHYDLLEQWKDGDYDQDWDPAWDDGPPVAGTVTPEGLNRAALENCVGAAFYPGIEVGGLDGNRPIVDETNYEGPFRLDHDRVEPGDVTKHLAVPWQADFYACYTHQRYSWWPVARPEEVLPQGASPGDEKKWDRDLSRDDSGYTSGPNMVDDWHRLGFVVEQEGQFVEVDRCVDEEAFVTLLTPTVDFDDVRHGPMGSRTRRRAIEFEVRSPADPVTLAVESGPSHDRIGMVDDQVTVDPTSGDEVATARLWVSYETDPGDDITDQVEIGRDDGDGTWTVDVAASAVEREKTAVSLVLDRSGSMDEDRGDDTPKHESLREAAATFVDAMLADDGVGLVGYNHEADDLFDGVGRIGETDDSGTPTTQRARTAIYGDGLDPAGSTSIGDGIRVGRAGLADADGYDAESLVVLTDGKENTAPYIADVAGSIDERTYAVGLGTPSNTSVPELQSLSGNHGGYLLVTGDVDRDDRFVLEKFFLQVLSGVSNADVVLDPEGTLTPGEEHRIPFRTTDVDNGLDVILLTDEPRDVDFRLRTPNGNVIEPWRADVDPAMQWVLSERVTYYRLSLPVEVMRERAEQHGEWQALLRLGTPQVAPDEDERDDLADLLERIDERERDVTGVGASHHDALDDRAVMTPSASAPTKSEELRYNLLVHAYSDLNVEADLEQSGMDPGADLHLTASVSEGGLPVEATSVRAEVARPDGTTDRASLERQDGRHRTTVATTEPGVYRVRVRARGRTSKGAPFQRERVLTGAVWHGGNRDAETAASGGGPVARQRERDRRLCETLTCLLADDGPLGAEFEERMADAGIDLDGVRECVLGYCRTLDRARVEEGERSTATPEELTRPGLLDDLEGRLDDLLERLDVEL